MIAHDGCGTVIPTVWKLGDCPVANNTRKEETKASGFIISDSEHMFVIS